MLKHLGNHYKKPSKAKLPWSIAQMRRMYHRGYPDTRSGRHRCLTLMFSNVGMLRKNASRRLTCTYELLPRTVVYAPDSRVKVVRERGQRPLIHAAVAADKNATSFKWEDSSSSGSNSEALLAKPSSFRSDSVRVKSRTQAVSGINSVISRSTSMAGTPPRLRELR